MKKDFKQELTELINKHGLEKEMRDTPDYILAEICIDAMAVFTEAIAQPEYMPLPAMKIPNDPQGLIITKWQLSPEELERVKETGTIHLSMLTFNQPLQPVLLTVDLPTEKIIKLWIKKHT